MASICVLINTKLVVLKYRTILMFEWFVLNDLQAKVLLDKKKYYLITDAVSNYSNNSNNTNYTTWN